MFVNLAIVGENGVGKGNLKKLLGWHAYNHDSENSSAQPESLSASNASFSSIKISGRRIKLDCLLPQTCPEKPDSYWSKHVHGIVLMYDVSQPSTFAPVACLLKNLRERSLLSTANHRTPIILLANKADRGAFVTSEVREFVSQQQIRLVEASCNLSLLQCGGDNRRVVSSSSSLSESEAQCSQLRDAAIRSITTMVQEINSRTQSSPVRKRRRSSLNQQGFVVTTTTTTTTTTTPTHRNVQSLLGSIMVEPNSPSSVAGKHRSSAETGDPNVTNPINSLKDQIPCLGIIGTSTSMISQGTCSSNATIGAAVATSSVGKLSQKKRRRSILDATASRIQEFCDKKKKKRRESILCPTSEQTYSSNSSGSDYSSGISSDGSGSELSDSGGSDCELNLMGGSITPRGATIPSASSILAMEGIFALDLVLDFIFSSQLSLAKQTSRSLQKLVDDVLVGFKSSITAEELVDAIISRWNAAAATATTSPEDSIAVRRAITEFLLRWLEQAEDGYLVFRVDETAAYNKLSRFIDFDMVTTEATGRSLADLVDHVQFVWTKKFFMGSTNAVVGQGEENPTTTTSSSLCPSLTTANYEVFERLGALDPNHVAQQLTLHFSRLFQRIQASELLNCNWDKEERHHLSPNLMNMIRESNKVQQWVWSQVLRHEELNHRVDVIEWFIAVAHRCLHPLKNYETMFAIIRGLVSLPVDRLKRTWLKVDESLLKKLESMNSMMMLNESHSKSYRAELKKANPPCVPYPGYWLSKLSRIKECSGLSTFVPVYADTSSSGSSSSALLNLSVVESNVKVIQWMRKYQHPSYSLPEDKEMQTLWKMLVPNLTDDDVAYDRSIHLEPAGVSLGVGVPTDSDSDCSSSKKKTASVNKSTLEMEKKNRSITPSNSATSSSILASLGLSSVSSLAVAVAGSTVTAGPSFEKIQQQKLEEKIHSLNNKSAQLLREKGSADLSHTHRTLKKWANRCETAAKAFDLSHPDGSKVIIRFSEALTQSEAIENICVTLSGKSLIATNVSSTATSLSEAFKCAVLLKKIFSQCLVGGESEHDAILLFIEATNCHCEEETHSLAQLIKSFKIPESYLARRSRIVSIKKQVEHLEHQQSEAMEKFIAATMTTSTAVHSTPDSIGSSPETSDKLTTEILELKRKSLNLQSQMLQLLQWKDNTKHGLFECFLQFFRTYEQRMQQVSKQKQERCIQRVNEIMANQAVEKRSIDEQYAVQQHDISKHLRRIDSRHAELCAEEAELERLLQENRERKQQLEIERQKYEKKATKKSSSYHHKIDQLQQKVNSIEVEVNQREKEDQIVQNKKHTMTKFYSYFSQVVASARDGEDQKRVLVEKDARGYISFLLKVCQRKQQQATCLKEEYLNQRSGAPLSAEKARESIQRVEKMQADLQLLSKSLQEDETLLVSFDPSITSSLGQLKESLESVRSITESMIKVA